MAPGSQHDVEAGALDLGSTSIKGVRLSGGGLAGAPVARPAPPLDGEDGIREGDPRAYARAAEEVASALDLPPGTSLGLATQRSTFLVWDEDGVPRTPLISWQDRRAADWCARHAGDAPDDLTGTTGLLLSAHYAGPKLASLLERSPALRDALDGGARFGTLDSWLIWRATGGRHHVTDPTMAARTLMYDLARRDWSDALLDWYGIPRRALPEIRPTAGRDLALDDGMRLRAAVSDQGAAVLGLLPDRPDWALVTLGTGAFVLRPADPAERAPSGYLRAPVLAPPEGDWRYVLEGTVNGAGAALDRFPRTDAPLPERDPSPLAFAIPDVSGLGAPHWRPDIGLELSAAARALEAAGRRRAVAEGLLFRIRRLLDDLCGTRGPRRLLLAGGLSADPALAPGLAALTGRPVEILVEREAGLLGAGRLAAGRDPYSRPRHARVEPGPAGAYLPAKYRRWTDLLQRRLAQAGPLDASGPGT